MTQITVAAYDPVLGAPGYQVVVAGTYAMLDFVPCRPSYNTNGPVCAFFAATVAGLDPNEFST